MSWSISDDDFAWAAVDSRTRPRLTLSERFLDYDPGELRELEGGNMGFSGVRAVIMIAILIALILAVTKLDMPGWILPVGLITSGILVKSVTIKRATA